MCERGVLGGGVLVLRVVGYKWIHFHDCQVNKNWPNLAISSLKKAKLFNMKKGQKGR